MFHNLTIPLQCIYRFTGHNAPLHGREEEAMEGHPGYLFSVFDTLKIWMDAGAPKEKLLMGFAQYGRGMTLSTEENGVYCPAKDGKIFKQRERLYRLSRLLYIHIWLIFSIVNA